MAVEQMLVAGASVVRKWLVAPESRIAHCLMVLASAEIVFRSTNAAYAYFWVGIRKLCLKVTFKLDLLLQLPAPSRQNCPYCW